MGDYELGVLICYESIFPALARKKVVAGADVLVNITNDLWYGDTAAPAQHLQIAAFRCIETRRALLRAANSGFTAIIDPRGRIIQRSELFTEDCLVGEVPLVTETTLFTLLGEIPVILLIIATAGCPAYAVFRRRKSSDGMPGPE